MQTATEVQAAIDAIDTRIATMVTNAATPGVIMGYKIGLKEVKASEAIKFLQERRKYLQDMLNNWADVIIERFD